MYRLYTCAALSIFFSILAPLATDCVHAAQLSGIASPIDWSYYERVWLPDLTKASDAEPRLAHYDQGKAANFLDHYAVEWSERNGCATCHTNVPALMARPFITSVPSGPAMSQIRASLLNYLEKRRARVDQTAIAFLIPGVIALAINDAESGRALDPRVADLLDFLYQHQSSDGSWPYPDNPEFVPFLERDAGYMAILMALAAGYTPKYFDERPKARHGLKLLKTFLRGKASNSLHSQAVLLWASARLPELLRADQKTAIENALVSHQNPDGGWTLAALGDWPRHDGAANDAHSPSDGYATGLVSLALCERGYSEGSAAIQKSISWLDHNQRVSGRWYTRSLFSDHFRNYLSNMATSYDVMALHACHKSRIHQS